MIDLPTTLGGWKCQVIDPPWKYEAGQSDKMEGRVDNHYTMLSDEAILHMKVGQIAAVDSQCWLWTTNSHLHLAFHCLERWGFTYKGCLTWVKNTVGVGFWFRGATEHLLFATKGTVDRSPFISQAIPTFFNANRREHSEKPDKVYSIIESVSIPPRLEIFARKRRDGWSQFGNQVEDQTQTVFGVSENMGVNKVPIDQEQARKTEGL